MALVGWIIAAGARMHGKKGVGRKVDYAAGFALLRQKLEADG